VAGLHEAFEQVGQAVERHLPSTHAPGLAMAVTDHEDILGVVVRGFADVAAQKPVKAETRFQIGSISKSFAAICALQEVEAGRLDLDAWVNDLLPWLELPEPFGPISLRHLLTHTAGLAIGTEESPTGPGAIAIARTFAPTFAPGERFWYSNDGYKLVGAVLERVAGKPVADLVEERILAPLQMTSTQARITNDTRLDVSVGYEPVFDDRPENLEHPLAPATWIVSETADGAIVSTVLDMSVYVRMLVGHGSTLVDGSEVRLLSQESFMRMIDDAVDMQDEDLPDGRYGLGLWTYTREGRRFVEHSGGMVGYTALLTLDPDTGIGCVALQNGAGKKGPVVEHAIDAVRASLRGERLPELPRFDLHAIDGAASLEGAYTGDRSIELAALGAGLRLIDGDVSVVLERWPDEKDAFCVPHPSWDGFLLRATRDADGRVTGFVHGPDLFVPEGQEPPPASRLPEEWVTFPAIYRSNDPWASVLTIFERAGRLFAMWPREGEELPLTPLDDGWFAVGEDWQPQRLRFEGFADGRPAIALYNGGRWYRAGDPVDPVV
jgi:CubicO group peptidase (beta-lactamase class C family)